MGFAFLSKMGGGGIRNVPYWLSYRRNVLTASLSQAYQKFLKQHTSVNLSANIISKEVKVTGNKIKVDSVNNNNNIY